LVTSSTLERCSPISKIHASTWQMAPHPEILYSRHACRRLDAYRRPHRACASDHEDMRKLRWHARVDKRAHLPSSFARGIRTAPPGSADRQRLVVGKALVKMQPHGCHQQLQQPSKDSLPPASKCLICTCDVSGSLRGICDACMCPGTHRSKDIDDLQGKETMSHPVPPSCT
jgi:hypothetical protein